MACTGGTIFQNAALPTVAVVYNQYASLNVASINSYVNFVINQINRFQFRGCGWWDNRINHWTQQLQTLNPNPNTVQGQFHYDLKSAKIQFAQLAKADCGC